MAGWADIRDELRRRIAERVWAPGETLPPETALAAEFGCARATVNRAVQALADTGLVERRRRAGTRVASAPTLRATVAIPILRREIEAEGRVYAHRLTRRAVTAPTPAAALALGDVAPALFLETLHLADGAPLAVETRWINMRAAPQARDVDFSAVSANEWLVQNARYSRADIAFTARAASEAEAALLAAPADAPLFVIRRTTWDGPRSVTHVELAHAPGFEMRADL